MRETRHLWIGNLPDNAREDKISDHFKRYGRIEKVKVLSKRGSDGEVQAVVAFVDLRSAQKAHNAVNTIGDKQLQTNYSEQAAMSSTSRHDSPTLLSNRHSQSSTHRSYTSHRSDSKTSEGHAGDRPHSDRRRSHQGSSDSSRNPDLSDSKSSQKATKDSVGDGGRKIERKNKPDTKSKKKLKKADDSGKNAASKPSKHKASRGRSPTVKKKTANRKQKREGSSSEDRATSSSYSSRTTGRSTSASSGSTSVSSSRSNSLVSSSPRSTTAESDSEGGQKLVTMIIKKLPARPSVNNLREGIYHEFKKCGKVKSVVIRGDNNNRHALVLFRNASEANKSVNHAKSKLLFGAAIEAAIYEGEVSGKELQECGGIIDEFHPRASRTLFVGNLDKTVGYSDIQNIFVRFGEIVAIEIKRQNNIPQYAFLQYTDIASVVKAIQKMDGEKLGKNTLKLGFGKTVISSCIWVAGVTESFTEHYLASCFQKHGPVEYVVIDRNRGQALVFYCKFEPAQLALASLRGRKMNGSRLKLDFASHKLIELFLTDMQNSGQKATTFESIRHLILSAPTTPSAPPPTTSTSRSSSRPGSSHPYTGAPDSYFDRYQPAPPAYDPAAPPPRSDWRAWEERNRGRNVYHSVSPRGRRTFDDDRPERSDYYHRDEECFNDRLPPSYDPDYSDYSRREHGRDYSAAPLPRGYADDYHRGLKPRDRRDPLYHSRHSPGRILRRSRSNSPRSGVPGRRGRMRDFDPKLEPRLHEHRDMPGRGRSPVRSPGSREDRGSGSDTYPRKYRDQRYGSPAHYYSPPRRAPSPYSRRADERRVELRDGRSLPGSPRSGGVRSKVVQDNSSQWPVSSSRSQTSSKPSESDEPWTTEQAAYDRSRSETPTRDENLDSIGEIIIKQPVVSSVITRTVKQEITRQKSIDTTSTKTDASTKSSSRASSVHSEKEAEIKPRKKLESVVSERTSSSSRSQLLQRVHSQSPPVEQGMSKSSSRSQKEKVKKHDERRKSKVTQRESVQSGSDTESGRKDPKHRLKAEKDPSKRRRDSRSGGSNLLKREYSPSMEKAAQRQKEALHVKQERTSPDEKDHKRKLDDRQNVSEDRSNSDRDRSSSTSKKRRHSEAHISDTETRGSSADKERRLSGSQDHRHGTHDRNNDDNQAKPNKRVRKVSVKHDAPMSIASQSFMDEAIDDEVMDSGPEAREPSSQFRPRLSAKEEDVGEMPDMEVTELEVIDHPEVRQESEGEEEDKKEQVLEESVPPVPAAKKPVGKVAIAQPFVSSYNPYSSTIVSATALMPVQVTKHKPESENKDGTKHEIETAEQPASNLTELEKEKLHLEQLLSKLDSEQKLGLEEASEVADIYITGITQKLKSHVKKDSKDPDDKPEKETEISQAEETPLATVETAPVDIQKVETHKPEVPVIIPEDQTVVEEVVAVSDEEVVTEVVEDEVVMVTSEEPVPIPVHTEERKHPEDVDLSKSYRKQMEAQRLKEQKRKEKEQKSLLKKQRKEQERQSKLVQKMRGPSQAIISAVDEDEETESSMDGSRQATPVTDVLPASEETSQSETPTESVKPEIALHEQKQAKQGDNHKGTHEVLKEMTSESAEPATIKPEVEQTKEIQQSPLVEKAIGNQPDSSDTSKQIAPIMAPPTNKTPIQVSPYTPKSASSLGKSSQTSHRSSSSNTNTPSPSQPKRKPHHHSEPHAHARRSSTSGHRPDKHGQRYHPTKYHPADPKRRKVDHRQSSKHHESERKRNVYSPPKQVANLTVALNVSPSEPLGKKELETLKAELETMRNQLSMDMSPGFLSPSSEEDTGVSPMSPILKSPTAERFMGLTMDNAEGKNLMVSPSQNRAQRLKQLGKVKKKTPLEDLTIVTVKEEEKIREMKKKLEDQRQLEFRHMRLFRSSIFEQDSARLSHLQQTNDPSAVEVQPAPISCAPLFSNLVDLNIDNKPLFSSLIESSNSPSDAGTLTSVSAPDNHDQVPKNAFPLSSDITNPAAVESVCEIAGGIGAADATEVEQTRVDEPEARVEVVDSESRVVSVPSEDAPLTEEETPKAKDTFSSAIETDFATPDIEQSELHAPDEERVPVKEEVSVDETENTKEESTIEFHPEPEHIVEDPPSIEVVQQDDLAMYSEEVAPLEVVEEHVVTVPDAEESAVLEEDATSLKRSDDERDMIEANAETKIRNEESVMKTNSGVNIEQKDEEPCSENHVEPEKISDEGLIEEPFATEVFPDVDDDFIESDLVIDAEPLEEGIESLPGVAKVDNTAMELQEVEKSDVVEEVLSQEPSHDAVSQSASKTEIASMDDETIEAKITSADKPLPKTECKKSAQPDPLSEGQVKKSVKPVAAIPDSKEKKENPFATKKDKVQGHSTKKHKTSLQPTKGDVKTKKVKPDEKRSVKTEKFEGKIKKDAKKLHKKVFKDQNAAGKSPRPAEKIEKTLKTSGDSTEKKTDKVKSKEKLTQKPEKKPDTSKPSKELSSKMKSDKPITKHKDGTKPHKSDTKSIKKEMSDKTSSDSRIQKWGQSHEKSHGESKPQKSSNQERPSVEPKLSKVSSQDKSTSGDVKAPKSSQSQTKSSNETKQSKLVESGKSEKSSSSSKQISSHKSSGEKKLKSKHSDDRKKLHKTSKEAHHSEGKASKGDDSKRSSSKSQSAERHGDMAKMQSKKDKSKGESKKESVPGSSHEKKKSLLKKSSQKSIDADQPVKKKPRLEERKPSITPHLTKSSFLNLSDSDDAPAKKDSLQTSSSKSKFSKYWSSDSDVDEVKPPQAKPAKADYSAKPKYSKPPVKQQHISSDSDSSDNYDDFISKMNKSSTAKKSAFYSSSDDESTDSDGHVSEKATKPAVVQKVAKMERHGDSDQSDRSSHYKESPMSRKESPSMRHREQTKDKLKDRPKQGSIEKSSKEKGIKSEKKKKLEKKKMKKVVKKHVSDSEEEEERKEKIKRSKDKFHTKHTFDSDDEDVSRVKPKVKKEPTSTSHLKPKATEDSRHSSLTSKLSSSSSSAESQDVPPPSPPSSFLTTKTIKMHTSYNPDYKDQFSASTPQRKETSASKTSSSSSKLPDPRSIYSSSSSDLDSDFELDIKPSSTASPHISKEERKTLLGMTSSDSDDDFDKIVSHPDPKPVEKKAENKPKLFSKSQGGSKPSSEASANKCSGFEAMKQPQKSTSKSLGDQKSLKKHNEGKSKSSSSDSRVSAKQGEVKSEKKPKPKHEVETKKEFGSSERSTSEKRQEESKMSKKHKTSTKICDEKSGGKHEEKVRESLDSGKKVSSKPVAKSERPTKPDRDTSSSKTTQDLQKRSGDAGKIRHKHSGEKIRHKGEHHKLKSKSSSSKPHDTSEERRGPSKDDKVVKTSSSKTGSDSHKPQHTKEKKSHPKPTESKAKRPDEAKVLQVSAEKPKTDKNKHPDVKSSPSAKQVDRKESSTQREKDDDGNESDVSLPGSSFFMASDTESKPMALKAEARELELKSYKNEDIEDKAFSPRTHSSPVHTPTLTKSIFSPSQSFETEERFSDAELRIVSTPDDAKHEPKQSVSRKSSLSQDSTEKAKDTTKSKKKEERKRTKSRDLSPAESRQLALSAMERFQLQHERRRKNLEQQKHLERQRDEEAVRSIMGDDESDDLVSSSSDADYLSSRITKSYSDNEPSAESSYYSQPKPPTEEVAPLSGSLTPDASIQTEKSDNDLGKSSDVEPRSKAEEIELAAAVSSIEGLFDDFKDKQSSDPDTSYQPFEEATKPASPKPQQPVATYDETAQREAAAAASALLSEPLFPQKNTSNNEPVAPPVIQELPTLPKDQYSGVGQRSPDPASAATVFETQSPRKESPFRRRSIERPAEVKKTVEAKPVYEEPKPSLTEPLPERKMTSEKQFPVQPTASPRQKHSPVHPTLMLNKQATPPQPQIPVQPVAIPVTKHHPPPPAPSIDEARPFVPLSTTKTVQPEPSIKETKHSPQIGVHAELPQALPVPSHRPSKDALPVAVPERKPPGSIHVHDIALPKQTQGVVGAKTNILPPFLMQPQHAGVRPDPYATYNITGSHLQKHPTYPTSSPHAPLPHAKVSPQASPTFKFPATSPINPSSAMQSPQHRPQGTHVISPTPFVSPLPSNKAFFSAHQHGAFTHPQVTPGVEQKTPPLPGQSPTAAPALSSPGVQNRPHPVSPHLTSPRLLNAPVGNLSSPTIRHTQPAYVVPTKQETAPTIQQNTQQQPPTAQSLQSPSVAKQHPRVPPQTAVITPVQKPPETAPEPTRQQPSQTTHTTSQPPQRPSNGQSMQFQPTAVSAQQYRPMVAYQSVPGQQPRHLPPSGPTDPVTTTVMAKSDPKSMQQMQIPSYLYHQQGLQPMLYQKFPIAPGVTFPRSPFGYMPGMHIPIGFPPQTSRPPSSGEQPRSFAPPHPQFTQSHGPPSQPQAQSSQVEKAAPQTPTSKGRATPGTPKPPTTPQSPHVPSSPSALGIPPQQMAFGAGRAPEQRPSLHEVSNRSASNQQDASALVAKHFQMSGFPSASPHRHASQMSTPFQARPGMPAGFASPMYRPEMGAPPFSHHLPAQSQQPSSQTRPPTSGHFYPPTEQQPPSQPPKPPVETHHPSMYHPAPNTRTSAPEPPMHHQQQLQHHPRAPLHHSYQQPPPHQDQLHHPQSPHLQQLNHPPRQHAPPQQTMYHPPTQPLRQRSMPPAEQPHVQTPPYQPPPEAAPPNQQPHHVSRSEPAPPPQEQGKEAQASLENLFTRYPVIWQGKVAIKMEFAAVQIHYVCGNPELANTGLPKHVEDESGLCVLRIARRMRLYPAQLETLSSRMATESEFCMLLALPCGRDKEDIVRQTNQLSTSFIKYMKDKEVAGIAESQVAAFGQQQRILHIFPPCDFTSGYLQQRAPDLLSNVADIQHLLIVITPPA